MERIKQAIANAKKTGSREAGQPELPDQDSPNTQESSQNHDHQKLKIGTIKIVAAFVIILLAAGTWLRLDCMNKKELQDSEQIHDGINQARAEGEKRLLIAAKFENIIMDSFTHCKMAAENAKDDYAKMMQDVVRIQNEKAEKDYAKLVRDAEHSKNKIASSNGHYISAPIKPEKFFIPQTAINETTRMLEVAQAKCQQMYDTQLQDSK